jgi:hypothetical protein
LIKKLLVLTLLLTLFPNNVYAKAKTYGAQEKDKHFVTCRLAKRKIVIDQKICVYVGPNNTSDTVFVSKWEDCPTNIKCIYEPNKSRPMIQEMMKSLEETLNKRKK